MIKGKVVSYKTSFAREGMEKNERARAVSSLSRYLSMYEHPMVKDALRFVAFEFRPK